MQLKRYQERVLSDLDTFLMHLNTLKNVSGAYIQTWMDNGVAVGVEGGIQSYKDTLPRVPAMCFKVPTGGGKTLIGCASLKHIYDAMEEAVAAPVTRKLVIWLVPSSAILSQTLKSLRDPNHAYRQRINTDFNSRVEVYDGTQVINGQNFSPTTVRENLSIVVLTFDALRIKRKDGRKAYQENGNLAPFVNTFEHRETLIPEIDESAAMQVYNQLSPVVIVDESHNATSELSMEMLKNLNPCFVLELTATPKKNSNIISIVSGSELKDENMIKLPVIVHNRHDTQDVIEIALLLRDSLERRAMELHGKGAPYIRPIALFQAQSNIGENAETFRKLKQQLIAAGIPEDQIAIKTSEIDEIKGIDLLSKDCHIRYIITVNALKEGWDCPFAYVLATLANRTSRVDVEQIVGRVLRLPYTLPSAEPMLNMSYVISSSNDFTATVNSVVSGLNKAGFSERDCRPIDDGGTTVDGDVASFNNGNNDTVSQPVPDDAGESDILVSDGTGNPDIPSFDPEQIRTRLANDPTPLTALEEAALAANREMEERRNAAQRSGQLPQGGDEMRTRYEMRTEFSDDAQSLVLPMFVQNIGPSLFSEDTTVKLSRASLIRGFMLRDKGTDINFARTASDMMMVDIDSASRPLMIAMEEREIARIKETLRKVPASQKRTILIHNVYDRLNRLDYVAASDLHAYVKRIVEGMTETELEQMEDELPFYVERIKKAISDFADEYREQQFYRKINTNAITMEPLYRFPQKINPVPTMVPLAKSLYTDEGKVNATEFELIKAMASLENVVWWHRIIEKQGFVINAFINHYPDFILRTKRGNIILVESKGDDRDNSNSKTKLRLGMKWADMAGKKYKYFMVFNENETGFDGALVQAEFIQVLKEL